MANSLPPQLTGLSFLDNRRSQVPRSWPKHELQVDANSFSGLLFTIAVGLVIEEKDMICRMLTTAPFVISTRRRSPLLTNCVLAREIWYLVLRRCNLQRHTPSLANSDFVEWWLLSRKQLRKEIRKAFDSLVILVAWSIWKERNLRIFQKVKLPVAELADSILDEAKVWGYAGIAHFYMLFSLYPIGRAWITV